MVQIEISIPSVQREWGIFKMPIKSLFQSVGSQGLTVDRPIVKGEKSLPFALSDPLSAFAEPHLL